MGIGGSGMSAVAQIAHHLGHTVSGCDQAASTPYLDKVKKLGLPVFTGHDPSHLKGIDILAVTPAVFYQNAHHPEFTQASQKGLAMKWQELMGRYLHTGKFVICIAGTHGKSTTTAWAGHLLENADLDPLVEIGATDLSWHNNIHLGNSRYFVCEADEFHDNFASYQPDIIILNNIEMDHPEYFQTFTRLLDSFTNFIKQLKPDGVLIYNSDSPGNQQLIAKINHLKLNIKLLPYSAADFPARIHLKLPGQHNRTNAMGIIKLAHHLHLPSHIISRTLTQFTGVGRRIELLGEKNHIQVYDDYANHPTAFAASIAAVKELHPTASLWAIIEPHTFSRLRAILLDLPPSVSAADHVLVSRIFPSRETDPGDFTGADIAAALHHPDARYIPEFDDITATLKKSARPRDVVLVMGSGNSHLLARQIFNHL